MTAQEIRKAEAFFRLHKIKFSLIPTARRPHRGVRHPRHELQTAYFTLKFRKIKLTGLLDPSHRAERCSFLPLVRRGVVQLLVLRWLRGEDGGHRQQDGGSVGVTHLVDHDGGENHAEEGQDSQSEDDSDHDVDGEQDVVHDDGEAGLGVDGLLQHESAVADVLTLALLLFLLTAQTGVGNVVPVRVAEQTAAVKVFLKVVSHVLDVVCRLVQGQIPPELLLHYAFELRTYDGNRDRVSEHHQTSEDHAHQEHDQAAFALRVRSVGSQDGDHQGDGAHDIEDEQAGGPTRQISSSLNAGGELSQQGEADDDPTNDRKEDVEDGEDAFEAGVDLSHVCCSEIQ